MSLKVLSGRWLRTCDAIKELSWSRATLFRRKKDGYFKVGTHFITTGPAPTSNLLWNIDAVRQVQGKWSAPTLMN
tara:strand:- start:48 stop:272 length:225 start_codon:yes stop_codon:yes gene_type:complete